MPRDLAQKNASRPKPRSQVPGWVWLFTGAVLGAFIMFLVQLSEVPVTETKPAGTATTPSNEPEEKEQPRFDFYTLLKETEVPVPAAVLNDPAETPATQAEYLLQVASFRDAADAEQLRAELILMNMDAHVEAAQVRNGETWNRVLIGPFQSRSKLAEIRSVLAAKHFETLILKQAP